MRKISIIVGLTVLAAVSNAASLTFDFNSVYTGALPGGGTPWATVTLTDSGAGLVDMVVSHNGTSAAGQFISNLELNLDPFIGAVSGNATFGETATFNSVSTGSFTDAGTTFDLKVDFNQSNANSGAQRLEAGESVTIQLSGTGLSVANFDAYSTGGTPVRALMHIQGIDGGLSSKVTEGVPEPATMVVLGGAALAAFARRKRK